MEDILFVFIVTVLLLVPIMRRHNGLNTALDSNASVDYEIPQVDMAPPIASGPKMMPSKQIFIRIENIPQDEAA